VISRERAKRVSGLFWWRFLREWYPQGVERARIPERKKGPSGIVNLAGVAVVDAQQNE